MASRTKVKAKKAKVGGAPGEYVTRHVFDLVFGKAFRDRIDKDLVREWASYGYHHPKCPRDGLPAGIWAKCLEAARKRWYPELSPAEGYREIGRMTFHYGKKTRPGKVFSKIFFSLISPEALAQWYPYILKAGRTPPFLFDVITEGPGRRRLRVITVHPNGHLMAGSLEIITRISCDKETATVTVENEHEMGYDLVLDWAD